MSRARFTILVVLLGLIVLVGSFVGAMALFSDDDGGPGDGSAGGTTTSAPEPGGDASTSTSAPAEPGTLETPAWVAIVASGRDEAGIRATADRVAAAGRAAGVLRSGDYPSLAPDLWVAYAGPFGDRPAAEEEVARLAAAGFPGGYPRCVGTVEECRA